MQRIRILAVVGAVVSVGISAFAMAGEGAPAPVQWAPGAGSAAPAVRALIPMYVRPPASDDAYSDWHRACDSSPVGSAMIANVHSGPGEVLDPTYRAAMEYCSLAGHKVLGYVATGYGQRSTAQVSAEVDRWYALYGPWLGGVFIDELGTDPATADYYQDIYGLVRRHDAASLVVGNSGTAAPTAWQLAEPRAVDVVVIFEGAASALDAASPPGWVDESDPARLAALVYDTSRDDVVTVCRKLTTLNIGWLQVTPETLADNPWDRLPPTAYLSRMRNACG